eukprot:GHVO01053453.1.p1 GENE.GHVO01053453.1~~GHVO01053453.1.p1  ORF type:complete len:601 (+),score=163.02 GHVO01053453.1:42-1844(+)
MLRRYVEAVTRCRDIDSPLSTHGDRPPDNIGTLSFSMANEGEIKTDSRVDVLKRENESLKLEVSECLNQLRIQKQQAAARASEHTQQASDLRHRLESYHTMVDEWRAKYDEAADTIRMKEEVIENVRNVEAELQQSLADTQEVIWSKTGEIKKQATTIKMMRGDIEEGKRQRERADQLQCLHQELETQLQCFVKMSEDRDGMFGNPSHAPKIDSHEVARMEVDMKFWKDKTSALESLCADLQRDLSDLSICGECMTLKDQIRCMTAAGQGAAPVAFLTESQQDQMLDLEMQLERQQQALDDSMERNAVLLGRLEGVGRRMDEEEDEVADLIEAVAVDLSITPEIINASVFGDSLSLSTTIWDFKENSHSLKANLTSEKAADITLWGEDPNIGPSKSNRRVEMGTLAWCPKSCVSYTQTDAPAPPASDLGHLTLTDLGHVSILPSRPPMEMECPICVYIAPIAMSSVSIQATQELRSQHCQCLIILPPLHTPKPDRDFTLSFSRHDALKSSHAPLYDTDDRAYTSRSRPPPRYTHALKSTSGDRGLDRGKLDRGLDRGKWTTFTGGVGGRKNLSASSGPRRRRVDDNEDVEELVDLLKSWD